MAEENVVSIAFADSSKAYQAFTEIKNLSTAGALQLKSGAIVVRDTEGKLSFPDGTGFAGGGLIGMLVGILGGPLGMLLGWGSGALIGGVLDAGRASATNEVLGEFSRALPVDSTAVIAEVVEPSELPLDDVVSKLGGTIVRRPVSEVVAELEAAEAAAEAAQAEARRVVRERKKAEYKEALEDRKAAVEKRWEELKGKFR